MAMVIPVTLFDAKGKPIPKPYFDNSVNDMGWGVAIYLQMQVDEESQINPGFGLNHPFRNAYATTAGANTVPWTATNLLQPTITAIPQFFSLGVGVGAAARATRVEAVQFTAQAARLLKTAKNNLNPNGEYVCVGSGKIPVLIDSDLKIDDFIVAKATLAASTNYAVKDDHTNLPRAPYDTVQETINFLATLNGGVTPSWKFARTSVNPNTPMASVQRDEINTVIVTLGQIAPPSSPTPAPPKPPVKTLTPQSRRPSRVCLCPRHSWRQLVHSNIKPPPLQRSLALHKGRLRREQLIKPGRKSCRSLAICGTQPQLLRLRLWGKIPSFAWR